MRGISRARPARAGPAATLLALFVYQLHVMHGESRIALLWALVGPVVLLTLISSLYILMGTHYILGMDVQTFAAGRDNLDHVPADRVPQQHRVCVRARPAELPGRDAPDVRAGQALLYVSVYLVVFVILIGAGHALELITLPRSWPEFMLYVVLMACCAAAMGLLFGAIATFWHFFLGWRR